MVTHTLWYAIFIIHVWLMLPYMVSEWKLIEDLLEYEVYWNSKTLIKSTY